MAQAIWLVIINAMMSIDWKIEIIIFVDDQNFTGSCEHIIVCS